MFKVSSVLCFRWLLVLLGVMLTGCALRQNDIQADYTLSRSDVGIVVGSVTSAPDVTRSPPWQEMSTYFFASVDNPNVVGVIRSGSISTWRWDEQRCDMDGIADECGRLFALELPAGEYVIKAVQINDLASEHALYPSEAYSLSLDEFNFTVVAGQTRYLGNLHSHICIGAAGHYGNLSVWAARGAVRDAYNRDWQLLTQKYVVLRQLPVEKAVIKTNPWLWMRPHPAPNQQWPPECGPYPPDGNT